MKSNVFYIVICFQMFVVMPQLNAADIKEVEFFENKIRPLFVSHCYECHSQSKKQRGGLLLDSKIGALKGGDNGPLFVSGKPEASMIVKVISYNDEIKMPPRSKLTDVQIADLTKWVKDGAYWPEEKTVAVKNKVFDIEERKKQWAWQPIFKSQPNFDKSDPWVKSPIDAFLLGKMKEKGLVPNPKAAKEVILRRIHFDLTGLPPSSSGLKSFLDDNSAEAFSKVVDKLLVSPAFGEKWARHWLDLVRYGESRGHEFDFNIPNAFQYRDYVIRAFNSDVPYNQFVKEHLAGDLLPIPRVHPTEGWNESILGTGFLYLGEEIHSPVDIRQDQGDRFDNRIDVIGKTFMGLTIACARCHDHKFDPIPTKDYYSLFGFLESSHYRLVRFQSMEKNKKVDQKLTATRKEFEESVKNGLSIAFKNAADEFPAYARAAFLANKTASESVSTKADAFQSDIILDDFESGSFKGWKSEGDAFSSSPISIEDLAPEQKDRSYQGKFLVNSYIHKKGKNVSRSDKPTGTLTSDPFLLERNFISFLVGGGSHSGKTCINLQIDGKVVASSTGKSLNAMSLASWDVKPWKGKKATIQIVDQESSGWGHIAIDAILQTDRGSTNGINPPAIANLDKKIMEKIATAEKVDANKLMNFYGYLVLANADPKHSAHFLAKKIFDLDARKVGTAVLNPVNNDSSWSEALKGRKVVVDYLNCAKSDWKPDDLSFGHIPVQVGSLRLTYLGDKVDLEIAANNGASLDPFWNDLKYAKDSEMEPGSLGGNRAGKIIATPSFILEDGWVHFLSKGKAKVFASVGDHLMMVGPLHTNLVRSVDSKELIWTSFDLGRYRGLPVRLEFSTDDLSFVLSAVLKNGADRPAELPTNESYYKLLPSLDDSLFFKEIQKQLYNAAELVKLDNTNIKFNKTFVAGFANGFINSGLILGSSKIVTKSNFSESLAKLIENEKKLRSEVQWESQLGLALHDGSAIDEKVFLRGSHKNPGEISPRSFLAALGGNKVPSDIPGSGRLLLADWMTDPKTDPFLPRVMVNRIWHHIFGRGIVASVDNFGLLGEKPTHPELLDFLATEFIDEGWSVKKMIRKMVLSSAYQTTSSEEENAKTIDPENLYLSHFNSKRLSAEAIRDSVLFISGGLSDKMYGPSVNVSLSSFQEGRGRPTSGPVDGDGRRSLYLSVRRNFLSSFMLAFDTPIPFSTVGKRSLSNVPSQALIMMNDPFIHQQSERWAKKVIADSSDAKVRLNIMFTQALNRLPTEVEYQACLEYLSSKVADAPEVGQWSSLAHSLINLKEFVWIP